MSDDSPRLDLDFQRLDLDFQGLDLGDPALLENIVTYVGNACQKAMIEVDIAARSLGEEGMKDVIQDGIKAIREALDVVSRHLPYDEGTQRECAQRFLEATKNGAEGPDTPDVRHGSLIFDTEEMTGNINGDEGIEGAVSPHLEVPCTEQDIVFALGWVRTIISDVQTVLLELDDGDLEELAQRTLISLRIVVGYFKRTHRTLTRLGLTSAQELSTDGHADSSAGPSLRNENRVGLPWEPLTPKLLEEAQLLVAKGKRRPLTAALVLAVVMPFLSVAVFFGAPVLAGVLAGDVVLQWGASTSVGKKVTRGAWNAVELVKLGWMARKLVRKQARKLANRELERVGGVVGLALTAGKGALWTAVHPIKATKMGAGLAVDAGRAVYHAAVWLGGLLATVRDGVFAGQPARDASRDS